MPTRRVVLLGHPVAHSLSPRFQQAAIDAAHIDARYEALDVPPDELPERLAELAAAGACGNVTVPHKEQVALLCGRLTPVASAVAAVNTFWVDRDGTLVGDNTDVGGFAQAAATLLGGRTADVRVVLLGAGGSAAAVCEAVKRWPGARVTIIARTAQRAQRLAGRYPGVAGVHEDAVLALAEADLLVNATPLGIDGDAMPVDPAKIPDGVAVMDLTYRAGRTPWVNACRARGLNAEDGLPMLIEQGALAFERWFGVSADRRVMREAVT